MHFLSSSSDPPPPFMQLFFKLSRMTPPHWGKHTRVQTCNLSFFFFSPRPRVCVYLCCVCVWVSSKNKQHKITRSIRRLAVPAGSSYGGQRRFPSECIAKCTIGREKGKTRGGSRTCVFFCLFV
ncbi:unnamed protein product [Ixodes pacificus]